MRPVLLTPLALLLLASVTRAQQLPPSAFSPGMCLTEATPLPDGSAPGQPLAEDTFWVNADYLLWWVRNAPNPVPLVTTDDPNDPISPGALGRPGTSVLFGGRSLDLGTFSGLRAGLGLWLDCDRMWGLEAEGFGLFQQSAGFARGSDAAGNPPTYVPAFRADLGREGSFTISDPLGGGLGPLAGDIRIRSTTQLWGVEGNGLANLYRSAGTALDLLLGYRYLDLEETLALEANLSDPVFDTRSRQQESFRTHNRFHGCQLGGKLRVQRGPLSVDLLGRVSLGWTDQQVNIQGTDTVSGAGAVAVGTFPGAIFTAPSNIGNRSRQVFGVVPQVRLKLSYAVLQNVHVFAGYDFLYWNSVVRPGNQIDRAVNPTQLRGGALVGEARPQPRFDASDFFAHGVSFGLEVRF